MELKQIQMLRFLAAFAVVVAHASLAVCMKLPGYGREDAWETGAFGVDIFFAISGFIMVISTQGLRTLPDRLRAAWVFMKKRIVRVVPLYWLFTALKTLLVLLAPSLVPSMPADTAHIIKSFLFIPALTPGSNPLGEIMPLLQIGWTLNFEMFFYLLFALAMIFAARLTLFIPSAFALVFAVHALAPGVISAFYTQDGILFEFFFGIVIAELFLRQNRIPAWLSVVLFAGSAFYLLVYSETSGLGRLISYGVPSALIVYACACGSGTLWQTLSHPFQRLGDASYSTYVSHPFVIPVILTIAIKLGIQQPLVLVILLSLGALVFSLAVHQWIEKPLVQLAKKVLLDRAPSSNAT